MKAISLWQPWASAMAVGSKRIETRHWAPPASAMNRMFAIHAAKRWTADEKEWSLDLQNHGVEIGFTVFDDPPLGAIVAVGWLRESISTLDALPRIQAGEFGPYEKILGNYDAGRFAWVFEDIEALPTPIPYRGAQGIFTLDDATDLRIADLMMGRDSRG